MSIETLRNTNVHQMLMSFYEMVTVLLPIYPYFVEEKHALYDIKSSQAITVL